MTRPEPDDLLSAYFDHEVTPEERAAAEQLLETDPTARQELEEIGGLSDLLKTLPREEAPDYLLPAALQRAERDALLPHATAVTAVASRPRRRREWFVVLAGLLTTSAAVLLMVNALRQAQVPAVATSANWDTDSNLWRVATISPPEGARRSNVTAAAEPEHEGLVRSATSNGAVVVPADAPVVTTSPAAKNFFNDGTTRSFQMQPATGPADPSPRYAVPKPAPGAPAVDSLGLLAGRMPSDAPADALRVSKGRDERLNDAAPAPPDMGNGFRLGQVLPYLARNDDGDVTVIEFTVVDIEQAASNFEVLLSRNQVAPQSGLEKEKLAERREKPPASPSDGLVAYFVQTEPELAGEVLRQLEAESWVMKVDLMPPVPGNELVPRQQPMDARQIEEVLVRNGIEYGNAAETRLQAVSPGQSLAFRGGAASTPAAATRADSQSGSAGDLNRRATGGVSGAARTQSDVRLRLEERGLEQQIVQRLDLRRRSEVARGLDRSGKSLADKSEEPIPSRELYEKKLAAGNNIRLLFILQPNDGLPVPR